MERIPGRKEHLFGEIEIKPAADPLEGKWVHVGNTGLALNVFESPRGRSNAIHFTPEGAHTPNPEDRLKYSTVFAYALLKLLRWLDTSESEKELGGSVHRAVGYSNAEFQEFLKHLLGEAIKAPEGDYDPDMRYTELDLDVLRNDRDVMERLERLAKRAESQDYSMID